MPRRSRKDSVALETAGRLATAIGEHPREFVALIMSTIAVFGIVTNALFLQKGPHPAPIFATRPLLPQQTTIVPRLQSTQSAPATDTGTQARLQLIASIQRELTRKGFYDGPADGIWGSKTDTAVRDFIQAAGLKINAEPSDALLRTVSTSNAKPSNTGSVSTAAADPIARLIAPSNAPSMGQSASRPCNGHSPILASARSSRPAFSMPTREPQSRSSNASAGCRLTARSPTVSCASSPA